jgi:hypothetical protein
MAMLKTTLKGGFYTLGEIVSAPIDSKPVLIVDTENHKEGRLALKICY